MEKLGTEQKLKELNDLVIVPAISYATLYKSCINYKIDDEKYFSNEYDLFLKKLLDNEIISSGQDNLLLPIDVNGVNRIYQLIQKSQIKDLQRSKIDIVTVILFTLLMQSSDLREQFPYNLFLASYLIYNLYTEVKKICPYQIQFEYKDFDKSLGNVEDIVDMMQKEHDPSYISKREASVNKWVETLQQIAKPKQEEVEELQNKLDKVKSEFSSDLDEKMKQKNLSDEEIKTTAESLAKKLFSIFKRN